MYSAFGVEDSRLEVAKADGDHRRRTRQGIAGASAAAAGAGALGAARSVSGRARDAENRAASGHFEEGWLRRAFNPAEVRGELGRSIVDASRATRSARRLSAAAGGLRTAGVAGLAGGTALGADAIRRRARQ